ncbi:MAG: carboxylate-amine ligase [Aestuariivita sp.]|nr:carboxylate-amine ligase [Aestuariivita sp.]
MQNSFSIGVEEEYLLVDRDSLALAEAPPELIEKCSEEIEGQVSPEFLQCQIEIGTKVCRNISEVRDDLKRLRTCVAKHASQLNLAPIAVSCHPFADWKEQRHTEKERYADLSKALGSVAHRLLICGMHVHIGIDDENLRIDLLPQLSYFLPHLLALSTSSPYWQGSDTGLASYRLTVFDNLPRTGLPPHFSSWAEYKQTTQVLIKLGIIENTTKIWWDLRPSYRFPTLETRIMDVSPKLEHSLSLAATVQAICRMLCRLRSQNLKWREYDRFLISENRWRAQRYGISQGLIDFGDGKIKQMNDLVDELIDLLTEDAEFLGSVDEIIALREILANGTSSTRQRRVYAEAEKCGQEPAKAVVRHLIDEFHADL